MFDAQDQWKHWVTNAVSPVLYVSLPPITAFLVCNIIRGGYPLSPQPRDQRKRSTWSFPSYLKDRTFPSSHFQHGIQTESRFAGNGTRSATLSRQMFHLSIGFRNSIHQAMSSHAILWEISSQMLFQKSPWNQFLMLTLSHCRRGPRQYPHQKCREWTEGQWNVGRFGWKTRLGRTSRTTRTHPIERARNAIADLRSSAFAHSLHQPGTSSWEHLPYPIDPIIWCLFWVYMDWFISTPEEPRPLYIHAIVYTPVNPVQNVQKAVYQLINQLFPTTVQQCLTHLKYRIRFRQAGDGVEAFPYPYNPHEVTFTHIRFTRFWSPVHYFEDFPYTTSIPPTPPSPPGIPEH